MVLADRPTTSRWTPPEGANAPIRSGRSSKARTEADTSSGRHPHRSQSHSEPDLGSAFDPTRTVARAGTQRFNTGIAFVLARGHRCASGSATFRSPGRALTAGRRAFRFGPEAVVRGTWMPGSVEECGARGVRRREAIARRQHGCCPHANPASVGGAMLNEPVRGRGPRPAGWACPWEVDRSAPVCSESTAPGRGYLPVNDAHPPTSSTSKSLISRMRRIARTGLRTRPRGAETEATTTIAHTMASKALPRLR
jgi:hypothetical protein